MLDSVRKALRISSSHFDDEIKDLINSAKLDLKIAGVVKTEDTDPLIAQAIKTYVKANFGLDNKDSEKYQSSYESIKEKLTLCGDYNE